MPPKKQKEAPVPPELEARLAALSSGGTGTGATDDWRALGNECFSRGSYLTAIRCYTKALEAAPAAATAVLHSNRSAAYLKSTMFSGPAMALKDAERAVELDPSWFKAHLRVADAQYNRKKYEEAQLSYEKALQLDPTCQAAKDSLYELKKEVFLRDLNRLEHERVRAEAADSEQLFTAAATGTANGHEDNRGGAAPGPEFRNAQLDDMDKDPTGRSRPPTEDETASLIRTWGMDTCMREDRTAMKPRTAELSEADRSTGKSYKSNLLQTFRKKVENSEQLTSQMKDRTEREHLQGNGVDYRQADQYRTQYARSTNGIGLGISADAYKEFTKQDKIW